VNLASGQVRSIVVTLRTGVEPPPGGCNCNSNDSKQAPDADPGTWATYTVAMVALLVFRRRFRP